MKIIDRIVIDDRPPENHSVLWIDTSDCQRVPKIYTCGNWRQLFAASVTYSDITNAILSYGIIPRDGGSVNPSISYSQIREVYIDDIEIQNKEITEGAQITYTATYMNEGATIGEDGTIMFEQPNQNEELVHIATVHATISINGKTTDTNTIEIYQEAQVDQIPDYYIGFCDTHSTFTGYSDGQLFVNSRYHDSIDNRSSYPSDDGYIYFGEGEKLMYILYNRRYSMRVDLDNPGSSMDPGEQSPEQIDMFEHPSVSMNGKVYNVVATYDANYTTGNGFRFKFI